MPAYILYNKVIHARLLPSSAAHAFAYPTLALLLPLAALEAHEHDLGHGRLFGYCDAGSRAPWARVTGIRPDAYLQDCPQHLNVRARLENVLARFGHDVRALDDAWVMTMPSYMAVEGINPLTVFYCYKTGEEGLWIVVLEVHNTFGERHVYVLPTGPDHEDKDIPPGFDHSWTFPRQFHVSPFNDRSGFYECAIVTPPHPPSSSTIPTGVSSPALPTVRVHLYTAHPSARRLKLTATLRPTAAAPLTTRTLLAALAHQPLVLLLSFPRIAREAFLLHYRRRLAVYARPEPRAVAPELESRFSRPTGSSPARNAVQRVDGELGVGGGIGWQPEGVLERYARRLTERFLERRARETGIRVDLVSANIAYERKSFPAIPTQAQSQNLAKLDGEQLGRQLTITFRTPRVFVLLLTSPSVLHALLLTRDAEQLLAVSDDSLFTELFSIPDNGNIESGATLLQRLSQTLRTLPVPRTLLAAYTVPAIHPLDVLIPPAPPPASAAPVSARANTSAKLHAHLFHVAHALLTFLAILALLLLPYLEQAVFTALRARFVRGDEPWGAWARAEAVWERQRLVGGSAGPQEGGLNDDGGKVVEDEDRCVGSIRRSE